MEMWNLYSECEQTVDGFQAQPRSPREWALFEWAGQSLKIMEDGANEVKWDLTAPIPAGFEEWSTNVDNVSLFFYLKGYIFIFFFSHKHFNIFEVFIFSDGL